LSGFLLIDKPAGMTSHDVVNRVRRLTGERCVGHAGTLDPFATGLLIVGFGREATREFPKLVGLDKDYEAAFVLGASSDTDDRTGAISAKPIPTPLSEEKILAGMRRLTGEIVQMPPNYSAVKVGGKKSYEAARKGETLALKPRTVTVSRFELLETAGDRLKVSIACSSGTYVRALARDLGASLGTGGYVEELRRTRIGPFSGTEATPLSELTPENATAHLLEIKAFLSRLPDRQVPATLGS
jgi:tRNA pseudouridine55 synthase